MLFDQRDEIRRSVAGQRRLREVRIRGDEILGRAMDVRKIASSAAGDQNLLSRTLRPFEYGNAAAPFARLHRAHQPGGARPQNQSVKSVRGGCHAAQKIYREPGRAAFRGGDAAPKNKRPTSRFTV